MIREIFHIGSFSISPFGVMLVFAFLGSYLQLRWGMKRLGIGDEEDASALVFAAGVGGIVGAKVYYAILNMDWRLLFDRSGLVWYGGFILGATGVIWMMRRRRLPAWPMMDVATPALALGYAIGRIGCFLVGDDYGRPTDLPWGVAFKYGLPETTAGNLRDMFGVQIPATVPDGTLLRVHPTQLYETTMALAHLGRRRLALQAPDADGHRGPHHPRPARRRALPGRDAARQGRPLLRRLHPGPGDQHPGLPDRPGDRLVPPRPARAPDGMTTPPRLLTIAGSDSGGGAGIQADLKTFAAHGAYGMSVIAALTAQNTREVRAVLEVPPDMVAAQIDAVLEDIGADAVKIGMLSSPEVIRVVAGRLRHHLGGTGTPIVLDPVMVAKSGDRLLREDAVEALLTDLLPLATLVTPNVPELEALTELPVGTEEERLAAAKSLSSPSPSGRGQGEGLPLAVLAKGGHAEGKRRRRPSSRKRPHPPLHPSAPPHPFHPRHRLHAVVRHRRTPGGGGGSANGRRGRHRIPPGSPGRGLPGGLREWARPRQPFLSDGKRQRTGGRQP